MTDAELVAKKLSLIETCVRELQTLERMAGFRNIIIVHGYQTVDLAIVRDVVENHLGDLVDFVAVIRRRP
jgi:uncharacterized protein YutE (UPF0331/DUF86 family)